MRHSKMYRNMRKWLAIVLGLVVGQLPLSAQEYLYEIGAAGGIGAYVGDISSNPFHKPGGAYGVLFRQHINYRWALKYNLSMTRVKGSTEGLSNVFPGNAQFSFSRPVMDFGAEAEFNFFHYGMGESYKGTRRFTPYIVTGLGFTAVPRKGDGYFSLHIPMGVGLKYKMARRWNLCVEFTMRKTLGDKLDGKALDDPYRITSAAFKNTDWYALTMISITYDIGRKCVDCNPSSAF